MLGAVQRVELCLRVSDDGEVGLIAGEVPVPDKPDEPPGPLPIA